LHRHIEDAMIRSFLGVAGIGALCLTAACGGDNTAPAGNGRLTVLLTDAPFPFDAVASADVYVVRIDAKLADADSADAARLDDETAEGHEHHGTHEDQGNRDPREGWVTIATPRRRYNLLELQNGRTQNLGELTLPTGTYRGFRLVLDTDSSSVTLTDGTVLTGTSQPGIKWPSAGRTGIKVKLDRPISLVENGTVMVLDFDLGASFVLRGRSIGRNGLLFKPVIRASARDLTGAIDGSVRCAGPAGSATTLVPGASVEVLAAGTALDDSASAKVVATTATDAGGAFRAGFVLPGSYALRVTRPAGAASCATQTLVPEIRVESGKTASAAVVLPAP
jgi:hypothetical protein